MMAGKSTYIFWAPSFFHSHDIFVIDTALFLILKLKIKHCFILIENPSPWAYHPFIEKTKQCFTIVFYFHASLIIGG
ncbi:hypothetical protein DOD46_16370 [Shigella flexneri]|nr:hypothetical protein [Shigella flexneri]